jgi:hypothetical protein
MEKEVHASSGKLQSLVGSSAAKHRQHTHNPLAYSNQSFLTSPSLQPSSILRILFTLINSSRARSGVRRVSALKPSQTSSIRLPAYLHTTCTADEHEDSSPIQHIRSLLRACNHERVGAIPCGWKKWRCRKLFHRSEIMLGSAS